MVRKYKATEYTVAAADCETDPFRVGRTDIKPFLWGIYDGCTYRDFWGDDATAQFLAHLASVSEPMIIYAHNGGKFDWLFIMQHATKIGRIISGRVVQAWIGIHEIRDSFANMPVPLRVFEDKTVGTKFKDFDYGILERSKRNGSSNKRHIKDYCKQDILVLYNAVIAWRDMFGGKALTMASAAFKSLTSTMELHDVKIERFSERDDEQFRPFYFGGRVECFERGVITSETGFKVYDVNSMYPAAMRDFMHPISRRYTVKSSITDRTDFAVIHGTSRGALPVRKDDGGVSFPHRTGRFFATGHEIRAGLELGLLTIKSVETAYEFNDRVNFADFVDHFYSLRLGAKSQGNEMLTLFFKLVLNSAYGKFAINPRKFRESMVLPYGEAPPVEVERPWRLAWDLNWTASIWERETPTDAKYIHVACAASITGAARSVLMRGLSASERPVYCDTDSIICESLVAEFDDKKLGAWKYEGTGQTMAIGGKKLYALFGEALPDSPAHYWVQRKIKSASKGVKISANEICEVASGQEVTYNSEAPTFKLDGKQTQIKRRVNNTAQVETR